MPTWGLVVNKRTYSTQMCIVRDIVLALLVSHVSVVCVSTRTAFFVANFSLFWRGRTRNRHILKGAARVTFTISTCYHYLFCVFCDL
jgi:hypothetical protein